MAKYVLIVDMDLCDGCKLCEMSCSLAKTGEVISPAKAKLRVLKDEKAGIDIPTMCQHCNDPPCIKVCPTVAIVKDSNTGIVTVNEDKCDGCKDSAFPECIISCPFEAVFFDLDKHVAVICDLCGGEPICVKTCQEAHPPGAIRYTRADSINDEMRIRVTRKTKELAEVQKILRSTRLEGSKS
jgi:Fe-S-cluster-containing dehydrogenase component